VLWFDACLFDQAILIRQLAWFAQHRSSATVNQSDLHRRFPTGRDSKVWANSPRRNWRPYSRSVIRFQRRFELARRAWRAFRAADPRELEALVAADTAALPYLRGALRRQLEQFPASATA